MNQKTSTYCAMSLVNIAKDLQESHPDYAEICKTMARTLVSEIKEMPEARVHSVNGYHNTKIDEEINAVIKEIKSAEDL